MFKCYYTMSCIYLQLLVLPLRVALCPVFKPSRTHQLCRLCEFLSFCASIKLFPTDREMFWGILWCVPWLDADPSSSPHSGSHQPESSSWKPVADWGMSLGSCHQCGVLAFCFRPEQISESRRLFPRLHPLMSFISLLLTSDLRPDQLYWFLRGVFLDCRHKSPEFPVQKVLQNKHRSLYFWSSCSSWSNSSIIAYTWLDFAPQVSMTTQPEGFNEWAS